MLDNMWLSSALGLVGETLSAGTPEEDSSLASAGPRTAADAPVVGARVMDKVCASVATCGQRGAPIGCVFVPFHFC